MPTFHLLIKGKVQGVFYRASGKEVADELGVKGWIKNTPSGDVEALVSGSVQELQSFISWCRRGPRRAEVSEVFVTDQEEGVFKDFLVVR